MPSTYCQNCGSKHDYKFEKPNFCTSCGEPFAGAPKENKKSETNPKENRSLGRRTESDFDEEGTEIYEVPQISKFEYEIDITPSSFSLGSLFSNVAPQEENSTAKKKRGRPRKNNARKR